MPPACGSTSISFRVLAVTPFARDSGSKAIREGAFATGGTGASIGGGLASGIAIGGCPKPSSGGFISGMGGILADSGGLMGGRL